MLIVQSMSFAKLQSNECTNSLLPITCLTNSGGFLGFHSFLGFGSSSGLSLKEKPA